MNQGHNLRRMVSTHFLVVLSMLIIMGFLMLFYGLVYDQQLVATVGTIVVTVAAMSLAFRVFNYEDYCRVLGIAESQGVLPFLKTLSTDELKEMMKKILQARAGKLPAEMIESVEDFLTQQRLQVVQENMRHVISLEPYRKKDSLLIRERRTVSCLYHNFSEATRSLFGNYIALEGVADCPRDISLFKNPGEVFRFVKMEIDGKREEPDEIRVNWIDPADYSKGVSYRVICRRTIESLMRAHVLFEYEVRSLEQSDFIAIRSHNITRNWELVVNHPPSLDISVVWFSSLSRNAPITPLISSVTFLQKCDGILLPGSGFVVAYKCREGKLEWKNCSIG